MSYCDNCFTLVRSEDGICARCGKPTGAEEAPLEQPLEPASPCPPMTADQEKVRQRTRLIAAHTGKGRQGDPALEVQEPFSPPPGPATAWPAFASADPEARAAELGGALDRAARAGLWIEHAPPPQEAAAGPLELPPATGVERMLYGALRWTRTALILATVAVLLVPAIRTLADMNRAAHASWTVQAQLGRQRGERRTELARALTTLQELYAELRKVAARTKAPSPEIADWRRRWQERLAAARTGYRLDGTSDFAKAHVQAEQALRNATLYLSSLERQWAGGVGVLSTSLESTLERSFEEARTDLY